MVQRDDFHAQIGTERLEWRDGFVRLAMDVKPQHLNRSGIIHGGVLLTLLDEAGSLCGVWCSVKGNRRSSVTVELSGHFTGQVSTGRVIATGEIVSHGRTLYFTRSEIRDPEGRVICYGTSTHKWRRGSESVEGAPPGG